MAVGAWCRAFVRGVACASPAGERVRLRFDLLSSARALGCGV